MSESLPLLDLERMFLPAWAKEAPPANRFEHYTGEEESGGRRRGAGRRREGFGEPRRGERGAGPRPERQGQRPPGRPAESEGQPRPSFRGRRDNRRGGPPRPVEREPLPKVKVGITIEDKVADSLARQIRATGRSYPIFDLARLILQKNDRFLIRFSVLKNNAGAVEQPLFRCALDESVWTDKEEALQYLLDKHFDMFYQAERTPTTPPKGVYTFVAVCDLNGAVLGPPNYHGYQEELRRLHREHYAHLPFEVFKSKIRIVRDEAVVKKWIEDQSWKTEYVCLNVPEAPRLGDRESVIAHFREVHLPVVLQEVESHTLNGQAALQLPSRGLRRLAFQLIEKQRRFPLELVHSLSALFNERKLQFFKLEKDITYVGVARPHYLDLETSIVSDNVRRIIQYIQQNPGSTRQKLIEALAPSPAPEPAPTLAPSAEATPASPTQGDGSAPAAEAPASGENAPPPAPEPTPEQMAIISDLHWLVHQGHVLELATGVLLTAKKPAPKPPKPAPAAPPAETETATPAPTPGEEKTSVAVAETAPAVAPEGVPATPSPEAAEGGSTPAPASAPESVPAAEEAPSCPAADVVAEEPRSSGETP